MVGFEGGECEAPGGSGDEAGYVLLKRKRKGVLKSKGAWGHGEVKVDTSHRRYFSFQEKYRSIFNFIPEPGQGTMRERRRDDA